MVPRELVITNPNRTKSPIQQEDVTVSKKTLGIHDSPARGNASHLTYIKEKATQWVTRMQNWHLPNHIAWVAYKHQLWLGLRYGLGTMTNDSEAAKQLLDDTDWNTLNILGVLLNITEELQRLNTTFGGFGLFSLPTKQLICQVNMLLQHYHVSTNLGKKLNASPRYLQLQLRVPHNPFTLDYKRWSHLAPLSWVKMLWRSLHHFDIHLHMSFPTLPSPREQDQVIMEIFLAKDLSPATTSSLSRCRGFLKAIFLSDITTPDRRYLEQFVFKLEKSFPDQNIHSQGKNRAERIGTSGLISGTFSRRQVAS
jgi:hypothetical protein